MRLNALILASLVVCSNAAAEEPVPAWVEQARSGAAELGSRLQSALMQALEKDGAVGAIGFCQHQAPEIAAQTSSPNLMIGRTALRVRNPANRPDHWERRVLEDFRQRLAAGEETSRIETFAIRNDGQKRWGHWMRAIPTQPICLTCHGGELSEEVRSAVDAAYPDDQARNFAAGELRGAFSVRVEHE